MIFKFRIISDENETFLRSIEISDTDTFLSFHNAIQLACEFESPQMTSFFVSNDDWDKGQEITLFDMQDDSTQTIPMEKSIIKDHVQEIEDKLIYVFDFFGDRALFCTLMEIKENDKAITYPLCSHSTGNAPIQLINEEDEFADLFNEMGYDEEDDFDDDDIKEEFDEFGEFGEFGGEEFNEKDF